VCLPECSHIVLVVSVTLKLESLMFDFFPDVILSMSSLKNCLNGVKGFDTN
jgi:hypothetical protein